MAFSTSCFYSLDKRFFLLSGFYTHLLETTDSWVCNIDRGFVNAVVFLDLKKAFDTVDHGILLTKMNRCGIQGCNTLDWFESYLTNRTQRCPVNGCLSDYTTRKCGVPQGTILCPHLFLIYIHKSYSTTMA